jgi:protein YIPF6
MSYAQDVISQSDLHRGPLVFSLMLSVLLSWRAAEFQDEVFTSVFALSWVGTMIVTWQIRLLGGKMFVCLPPNLDARLTYNSAFFQTVCIIGYTLFPLVIAALLSAIGISWIIRIPVYFVLLLWAFAAGISILGGSGVVRNRVGLAVYPLFVFYLGLSCLCFIS